MAPDPDVHAPPAAPAITAPAPPADPAAERRRRQIERGVFKRRNVTSGNDPKAGSKPEDEPQAHPS